MLMFSSSFFSPHVLSSDKRPVAAAFLHAHMEMNAVIWDADLQT